MAVKVKDAAAAAQKFVTRAGAAGADYAQGVANAAPDWQKNTAAAADSFAQGVQQAIQAGRFQKGVNSTSAQKYTTRAAGVGATRYPTGVAGSKDAWQQNTAPYLQTIANLNLPPKGPKGSPQNNLRIAAVTEALRAKKLQGTS
jgi:hypothetical protein